jgi:hypothetical protein
MNEVLARVIDAHGGMNDLLDFVIKRRGGIDRWYEASTVSATVHVHGGFWAFKGQPDRLGVESVTADIHRQRITMTPFGDGSSLEFDARLDRVRGSHQGQRPKRLHSKAGYMAASERSAKRSDSLLHRGRRPYMALLSHRFW